MSQAADLIALTELSQLILDRQLARLHEARHAEQTTRGLLAGLKAEAAEEGLSDIAALLVQLRYQTWADKRRSDLNLILAQQTADVRNCLDEARLSFGRNEALQKLRLRQR